MQPNHAFGDQLKQNSSEERGPEFAEISYSLFKENYNVNLLGTYNVAGTNEILQYCDMSISILTMVLGMKRMLHFQFRL